MRNKEYFYTSSAIKNVIVLPFTSYCFNFRSLTASKENSNKFPKVTEQSATHYILIYLFLFSSFIHLGKSASGSNTYWRVSNTYSRVSNTYPRVSNTYSSVLNTYCNILNICLNNFKTYYSNSKEYQNIGKVFLIHSNFAICPLNHLHDHPATTPGSTVCLKR